MAVSASGFAHLLAVARVAVALGNAGHRVGGERELRAWERAEGRPLASAEVGLARDGTVALHRPDLVCWGDGAPIAVEVELTVKAPARLRTIVRGWARSRLRRRGRLLRDAVCRTSAAPSAAQRERGRTRRGRAARLAGSLAGVRPTSSIPSAA